MILDAPTPDSVIAFLDKADEIQMSTFWDKLSLMFRSSHARRGLSMSSLLKGQKQRFQLCCNTGRLQ